MEIIVGSYEGLLMGYSIKSGTKTVQNCRSIPTFIDKSHSYSVKCIDVSSNNIMATGVKHESEITSLKFLNTSYLYACGMDGNISIWNLNNWNCEKVLLAHQGPISSIAIHYSGKLMLSIGQDKKLITWNLTQQKKAFVTNLDKNYDQVIWSIGGSYYALFSSQYLQIYQLETASLYLSLKFGHKATTLCFIEDDLLLIAIEKGFLKLYNLSKKCTLAKFNTKQNRVKQIILVNENIISSTSSVCYQPLTPSNQSLDISRKYCRNFDTGLNNNIKHKIIITASSDGTIKLFDLDLFKLKLEQLLVIDTSCRITCMAISNSKKHHYEDNSLIRENIVNNNIIDSEESITPDDKLIVNKKLKKSI
ncbi:p21-activated protein kinase-interacting protein 1-like isoform X2 [Gordionus sp. m RMFG-2023]|uniref:p21-activated protein kinase-interacting protein 1-like isoform X2 n=1 Tax=Gordionus sp. m RMFG-2023 TaxID=3053472 RepID=UPI0031FDBF54